MGALPDLHKLTMRTVGALGNRGTRHRGVEPEGDGMKIEAGQTVKLRTGESMYVVGRAYDGRWVIQSESGFWPTSYAEIPPHWELTSPAADIASEQYAPQGDEWEPCSREEAEWWRARGPEEQWSQWIKGQPTSELSELDYQYRRKRQVAPEWEPCSREDAEDADWAAQWRYHGEVSWQTVEPGWTVGMSACMEKEYRRKRQVAPEWESCSREEAEQWRYQGSGYFWQPGRGETADPTYPIEYRRKRQADKPEMVMCNRCGQVTRGDEIIWFQEKSYNPIPVCPVCCGKRTPANPAKYGPPPAHLDPHGKPDFTPGDLVMPRQGTESFPLHCGSGTYPEAVVVCVDPFVLVSCAGDMRWSTRMRPQDFDILGKATVDERARAVARFERDVANGSLKLDKPPAAAPDRKTYSVVRGVCGGLFVDLDRGGACEIHPGMGDEEGRTLRCFEWVGNQWHVCYLAQAWIESGGKCVAVFERLETAEGEEG